MANPLQQKGKVRPPQLSQRCRDNLLIGKLPGELHRTPQILLAESTSELDLQSGCDCCHPRLLAGRVATASLCYTNDGNLTVEVGEGNSLLQMSYPDSSTVNEINCSNFLRPYAVRARRARTRDWLAVAIIRELQPFTGNGRYRFPSLRTKERPISDVTLNAALRRL
jgi:hypothetical protein